MNQLARRLGTGDAVVVGLSAMIGAGVFSVFAPAAAAAGGGLLIGLAIAALVAFCNAVASTQLAGTYPSSGGTYLYGREVLGPWWGFVAGWGFVVGKTASCAAMALTFAAYAVPEPAWAGRAVAVAAVVSLTVLNLRGITRTAIVARLLLVLTLSTLVVAVVATATGVTDGGTRQAFAFDGGVLGVLQAAGLLFFAFAGYARIATLAEEVRSPATLGRAVLVALGVTVALYAVVAVVLLRTLGSDLAETSTPLSTAAAAAGAAWAEPVLRLGAVAASLGALLALLAGVGRTTLAMARERDLPGWLASVDPRHQVPDHAQVVVGSAIVVLVLAADLRDAIGFSSFGVLVYYAVANASAYAQPSEQRRWPRALNVLGLVGCLGLAATLPGASVIGGVLVLAVGLAGRALALRRRAGAAGPSRPA
jgi:APA family basic amino acid/polyamine antiporter